MKELDRRVFSVAHDFPAGVSTYSIEAEILVEDEGRKIYFHTEWVDAASTEILFEATTESVYVINEELEKLMEGGDRAAFEAKLEERNRVREETVAFPDVEDLDEQYPEQFHELIEMMQEKLDDDGELYLDLEVELGLKEDEEAIDAPVWL